MSVVCTKNKFWETLQLLLAKRSSALIKSDRINVLRKQYDSFLEEDKKRKERNEYILGKLDKMRTCTAVVPMRYKNNIRLDQTPLVSNFQTIPVGPISLARGLDVSPPQPQLSNLTLDVSPKVFDEKYVLNEISKKYILIPKSRPSSDNDFSNRLVNQDISNDNDWKSKYSILDELKQNEKGDTAELSSEARPEKYDEAVDDTPVRLEVKPVTELDKRQKFEKNKISDQSLLSNVHSYEPQIPHRENDEIGYNNKITKIDIVSNNTMKHLAYSPDVKTNVYDYQMPTTDGNQMPNTEVFEEHTNQNDSIPTQQEEYHPNVPEPEAPVYDYSESGFHNAGQKPYQNDYEHNDNKYELEDKEKIFPVDVDISHVEVESNADQVVNNDMPVVSNEGNQEILDYPIDVINVAEFTPNSDVKLVDGVNINPEEHVNNQPYVAPVQEYEAHPNVVEDQNTNVTTLGEAAPVQLSAAEGYEHTNQYDPTAHYDPATEYNQTVNYDPATAPNVKNPEDIVNTSGIEEFNTEQNDMFYPEQPAQNYEGYNQQDVVDVYNNVDYAAPNEGYDPNVYYDGAQPEEAYPVEINEHEEATQRYDPNYENQYTGNYETQQEYVEQQQYQQVPDQTQQQYEQYQYEQQPPEPLAQLEQQLDSEQGYSENQMYNVQDQSAIEGLMQAQVSRQIEPEVQQETETLPEKTT